MFFLFFKFPLLSFPVVVVVVSFETIKAAAEKGMEQKLGNGGGKSSVTRLGDFLKFWVKYFVSKVAQMYSDFWAI